jgi:hypothetical protein
MRMKIVVKTRWLLPILMIGLAILAIEPSISASDQSLTDATLATEGTASGLEPATPKAETSEATQAQFDDTALGTY